MSSKIIADYRDQAAECFSRSKTSTSTKTKMLWLTIAEDWLLLADRIEMNEARSVIELGDDGDAQGPQSRVPPSQLPWPHHSAANARAILSFKTIASSLSPMSDKLAR
jgi:hypothetical protein